MSDPNMPHEPSGDPGATEENPLARLLFGWVEAPRTLSASSRRYASQTTAVVRCQGGFVSLSASSWIAA